MTGGASFIGSHLVDALVRRGARVRVADNLSSGELENLTTSRDAVDFHEVNLLDADAARRMCDGIDVVFHLAADHGGRGYIHHHQVECSTNMILDGVVFRAAAQAGVEKVVYASSGCVYPTELQADPGQVVYLREDLVGPPFHADELYGWAKLMGEMTLRAYCAQGRLRGASLRYFTAYGPRCLENHAVMAMIARAYIDQDPFEVWGNGQQVRNWTYVDDIVEGTILAAEKIDDGTAVNLGTMERVRVLDAVQEILSYTDKSPAIKLDPTKPTGPLNRVCDNSLGQRLLGWTPRVAFADGVRATADWYFRTKSKTEVRADLPELLLARKKA